ncbi:MAG: DNA repair protein RecO [Verrucomicrobia bacterium]|jgi:DNA repair protein RecO (recombination protein O)|nr:DNA repair protein RecO [Verrucomicrobiota bacterium]
MIQSATGLMLRTRPLTETSLIVLWLTPEFGRISTVAKGARRPKSPFAGKLDLFYLADFSFSRSRHSDLHALREVSLRETHRKLRNDLGLLQQASYCAALVQQTTETDTPLPTVYELMRDLLDHLVQHPSQPQTTFAFELKLLKELGLAPDLAERKLSAGAKRILEELAKQDWPAISRLKLSMAQTRELQQFLHVFLIYHLDKIPRGRSAALAGGSDNAG